MTYLGEVTFLVEGKMQGVELWETEEGGVFGIDCTFLESSGGKAYSPFDGQEINLPDPRDAEKKKIEGVKSG